MFRLDKLYVKIFPYLLDMELGASVVAPQALAPIRVNYDAGCGNTLELRGTKNAGFCWEQGKALICTDKTHWKLDVHCKGPFEYRLVLNKADGTQVWEKLEKNHRFPAEFDDGNPFKGIVPIFE